jgi:hypothetical protein
MTTEYPEARDLSERASLVSTPQAGRGEVKNSHAEQKPSAAMPNATGTT